VHLNESTDEGMNKQVLVTVEELSFRGLILAACVLPVKLSFGK